MIDIKVKEEKKETPNQKKWNPSMSISNQKGKAKRSTPGWKELNREYEEYRRSPRRGVLLQKAPSRHQHGLVSCVGIFTPLKLVQCNAALGKGKENE